MTKKKIGLYLLRAMIFFGFFLILSIIEKGGLEFNVISMLFFISLALYIFYKINMFLNSEKNYIKIDNGFFYSRIIKIYNPVGNTLEEKINNAYIDTSEESFYWWIDNRPNKINLKSFEDLKLLHTKFYKVFPQVLKVKSATDYIYPPKEGFKKDCQAIKSLLYYLVPNNLDFNSFSYVNYQKDNLEIRKCINKKEYIETLYSEFVCVESFVFNRLGTIQYYLSPFFTYSIWKIQQPDMVLKDWCKIIDDFCIFIRGKELFNKEELEKITKGETLNKETIKGNLLGFVNVNKNMYKSGRIKCTNLRICIIIK